MKKVLTMTLNPCIDKTVYFESFQTGATNIVKITMEEAAGKGINVAVGLRHLQVPVKALGFAYKEDKDKLYGKLDTEQIPHSFVEVDGRLRVNQKLFDESKSEMTECNEKGMPVAVEEVDKLLQLLKEELADASILVLSGSVPPGVSADIYAIMTSIANEVGVKVILDASGELLAKGIEAKPYLIKPNKEEFRKTFVEGADRIKQPCIKGTVEPEDILEMVAERIISQGISYVCLSMGEEGATIWSRQESNCGEAGYIVKEKRPAIKVPVRSLQGAGDAMVAGLCKAIYDKREDRMLDYALAMAASTIALEGTQMGSIDI
jgi:1-phosphofructokinase